jgi:excisionase family DNA binding protein
VDGLLMDETPLDEVFEPYPTVLTVEQVAELLGRDAQDTYRRLQQRHLPFGRKEGGRWLIYKAEVRRYLESLDEPPQ